MQAMTVGPRPQSKTIRERHGKLLLDRYARCPDTRTRDELIEHFMPLARSLAGRFRYSREPLEDLVQVASLALVKSVERFDPQRGYAFSSFAVPTILGELRRHLRDRTWAVRPPRDLQELMLRLDRTVDELSMTLQHAPTIAQIAAHLHCSEESLLEAMQARLARNSASLDAPLAASGEGATFGDAMGDLDAGYETVETRETLACLAGVLSERDALVLQLRFVQDMTQAEIGAVVGVSQMQVSRIIRASVERLREQARSTGADVPIAARGE